MADRIVQYRGDIRTELQEYELKTATAQFLQAENLNFLIGAGCSSHKDDSGEEKGIYGMKDLYRTFFKDYIKKSICDYIGGGMSEKELNHHFKEDLEKLLEYLDALAVVAQCRRDLDTCGVDEQRRTIRRYLKKKILEGTEKPEVGAIYREFYRRISQRSRKEPVSIFTTNYDMFSEAAMDDLGFLYNNGFTGTWRRKFNPLSYSYACVENMNLRREAWEPVPFFFNLVKLHGSVSWYRGGAEAEDIFEGDCRRLADGAVGDDSDRTVMIYPTPMKDRSTLMTPYSDLFRVMENRLARKNTVLIVLGYSFRDPHINRVILNSLAVPSFQLVVFGVSEDIDSLIRLKDPRITIIRTEGAKEGSDANVPDSRKIHYFKNFVERALPEPGADMDERRQLQKIDRLVRKYFQEELQEKAQEEARQ